MLMSLSIKFINRNINNIAYRTKIIKYCQSVEKKWRERDIRDSCKSLQQARFHYCLYAQKVRNGRQERVYKQPMLLLDIPQRTASASRIMRRAITISVLIFLLLHRRHLVSIPINALMTMLMSSGTISIPRMRICPLEVLFSTTILLQQLHLSISQIFPVSTGRS